LGKASATVSTRVQPGSSTIDAADAAINTATPGVISWLPARYEDRFLVTCYTIADEAAAAASSVSTQVCGLPPQNAYRSAFLTDTKMQGSGKALDGTFIHYKGKGCYNTDTCARTATGECAVVATTIAVDPKVIPRRSTVDVAIMGQRLAQDTGGKILGYHIDEFVGLQGPLCKKLGLRNSAISLVKY
jgi:3D (Asp-Asp-Asp) domain-containing protein